MSTNASIMLNNVKNRKAAAVLESVLDNGSETVPYIASTVPDITALKRKSIPKIAETWTFYNLLGKVVTQPQSGLLDSSPYDKIDLVEGNIKAYANISLDDDARKGLIDPSKIYVQQGKTFLLVDNYVSYIFMLEINKIKKYFDSYEKLEAYAKDYVKREAILT